MFIMGTKLKSMCLRDMPEDVYKKLLKIQGIDQATKGRKVSRQEIIYKAIRMINEKSD